MRRQWIVLLFTALASANALANQDYFDAFSAKYKASAELLKKECAICHVSADDYGFNPYGKSVKAKAAPPSPELFASLEAEDADGDGTPNGAEIAANTLPGDPTVGGKPGATPVPAPVKEEGPIPKTAFHPAIVHFPIGLFMAGLLLDFLGLIKREEKLLFAGWYNIVLATISSIAAVASGFGAMILMGFPVKGNMLNHLMFTIAATVMMWAMVSLRVHKHEQMNPTARTIYYVLAVACLAALSWAGHLGGMVAGTA